MLKMEMWKMECHTHVEQVCIKVQIQVYMEHMQHIFRFPANPES